MKSRYTTLAVITLFLLTASVTYAAGLVPCGGPNDNETMCRACDFVVMAQKIMVWFVAVSASIVALMFALGGMKMVMSAGNTGKVSEGKEMMTNSVIGFLILLGAWLIVNTILVTVMKGGQGDGNAVEIWGMIECKDNPAMFATNPGGMSAQNTGGPIAQNTGGQLTDTAARALLADAGITVNKTAAQGTSLEGMNNATVQDAIALKKACPSCDIVITAGTESTGGHTVSTSGMGHSDGYKYDIRLTPSVTSYIENSGWTKGVRNDKSGPVTTYTSPSGTVYAKEADASGGAHWDVLVKG